MEDVSRGAAESLNILTGSSMRRKMGCEQGTSLEESEGNGGMHLRGGKILDDFKCGATWIC